MRSNLTFSGVATNKTNKSEWNLYYVNNCGFYLRTELDYKTHNLGARVDGMCWSGLDLMVSYHSTVSNQNCSILETFITGIIALMRGIDGTSLLVRSHNWSLLNCIWLNLTNDHCSDTCRLLVTGYTGYTCYRTHISSGLIIDQTSCGQISDHSYQVTDHTGRQITQVDKLHRSLAHLTNGSLITMVLGLTIQLTLDHLKRYKR